MKTNNVATANAERGNRWKDMSRLEKRLLLLAILAVSLLVALVVLFVVLMPSKRDVCTKPACVRASVEILNLMDQSVDPCEDFYEFSCGNFLKTTRLEGRWQKSVEETARRELRTAVRDMLEEPIDSHEPAGLKAAKKLYKACMNTTHLDKHSLKRIKGIFKEIGGFPLLDGNQWRDASFDWKEATKKLRKIGVGHDQLLEISVEKDERNPTQHILAIEPTYVSVTKNETQKNLETELMEDMMVAFGAERSRARSDLNSVYDFRAKLEKVLEKNQEENATGGSNSSNRISLSELQYKFPAVNWIELINGILAPATSISYDDVVLASPAHLEHFLQVVRNTPKKTIANFLCLSIVGELYHLLPQDLINRIKRFAHDAYGSYDKTERWEVCYGATFYRFSTVISGTLIERTYTQEARDEVVNLYVDVMTRLQEDVGDLEWMDKTTKNLIHQRLQSSTASVVTKEEVYENDGYNNVFNEIPVYEDRPIQSVLNANILSTNRKYEKLRQLAKTNRWSCKLFPTGFEADYNPKRNSLAIAAGLLQGIYFDKDRPRYVNHGILGPIIARELSRVLSEAENPTTGAKLRDGWTTESLLNYHNKARCLTEQYKHYYVEEIDKFLNASNTQDQDVADQAGFKISYDAYRRWAEKNGPEPTLPGLDYTPNQLFWISTAIPLCAKYSQRALEMSVERGEQTIEHYRVVGGLRNIEGFADDFRCPAGSRMNPGDRCVVW